MLLYPKQIMVHSLRADHVICRGYDILMKIILAQAFFKKKKYLGSAHGLAICV